MLRKTVTENPYIPALGGKFPSDPQAIFLSLSCREGLYGGAAGGGKMLDMDTPVPTPSGWTTIGKLSIGDEIFTERGAICHVLQLHPIDEYPESHRLQFDDGTEIDACADHLWLTFDADDLAAMTRRQPEFKARRRANRERRATGNKSALFTESISARNSLRASTMECLPLPTGSVRTTREIAATLLAKRGRANHAIQVAEPLELPDADLPIDPYVLGAWLGDGTTCNAGLTSADLEIVDRIRSAGWSVRKCGRKYAWIIGETIRSHRANGGLGLINTFSAKLRRAGVLGNKHVPLAYLRGSISQRLELLRGLMDTDGTATDKGAVEFTNTNKRLVEAVAELAVSLGDKATIREGVATLNGRAIGPKWRIKWKPSNCVFHLPRKADRQKLTRRRTTRFRYVVSCDRIVCKPMRCITVDNPTSLFLVGKSMVPTHNSAALLAGGLQYVTHGEYHALLMRRSYPDLEKPGGLIPLSVEWLAGKKCKYDQQKHRWNFPSGATLSFGHAGNLTTLIQDYQGSSFGYIAPDELTQWPLDMYRFLFRSLRAPSGVPFPLRMRASANPGGEGHEWVKARFIDVPVTAQRFFIPAKLEENPGLDQADYERSLEELDPVMRRQLRHGDWDVRPEGNMFRREWFNECYVERAPAGLTWERRWDLAATKAKVGKEPDWCAGCLIGADNVGKRVYVADMQHFRESPRETEQRLIQMARIDGPATMIRIEQEPGAASKLYIDHIARLLNAFDVRGVTSAQDKVTRARPASAACERGDVFLVRGPWVMAFLDELCAFPSVQHDDQVDAFTGGYSDLASESEPWELSDVGALLSYGAEN